MCRPVRPARRRGCRQTGPRSRRIANGDLVTLEVRDGAEIAAARQALESQCDAIVAGGGDGTLNAVASAHRRHADAFRYPAAGHAESFRPGPWHTGRPGTGARGHRRRPRHCRATWEKSMACTSSTTRAWGFTPTSCAIASASSTGSGGASGSPSCGRRGARCAAPLSSASAWPSTARRHCTARRSSSWATTPTRWRDSGSAPAQGSRTAC